MAELSTAQSPSCSGDASARATVPAIPDGIEDWPAGRLQRLLAPHIVVKAMLLLGMLGAALFLVDAAPRFKLRADTSYPESAVLQAATTFSSTGHIYTSIDEPPYTPSLYGPLTYMGLGAIAAAVSSSDMDVLRSIGRVAVFACFLMIPLIVYHLLRVARVNRSLSLVGALAVFAQPFAVEWSVTVRPDVVGVLISLVGLALLVGQERPSLPRAGLAGIFCALAFLLKATFVSAAIAISVVLVSSAWLLQFAGFAAAALLPVVAVFLGLVMRHERLLDGPFIAASTLWDPVGGMLTFSSAAKSPAQILLLAIAVAGGGVAWSSGTKWGRLVVVYCVTTWVLCAVALVRNVGGSTNYLLEPWIATALLIPLGLSRIVNGWQHSEPALRAAILIVTLLAAFGQVRSYKDLFFQTSWHGYGDLALLKNLRVLSNSPYLPVHGRDPELLDPYASNVFETSGRWSPQGFIQRVAAERYDLVVLGRNNAQVSGFRGVAGLSRTITAAIDASYQVSCESSGVVVLVPRSRSAALTNGEISRVLGQWCGASTRSLVEILRRE